MCELFGFSAKDRRRLNDSLKAFYAHSEKHPDGWGLACFSKAGIPVIEKEPVTANASAYLAKRLSAPIEERILIAHIRRASIGALTVENCHPFARRDNGGRVWTLAHNGTVAEPDRRLESGWGRPFGQTDSERILLHLVNRINLAQRERGRTLDEGERFDLLAARIAELAKGNSFNLIFFDGEILYVHNNVKGAMHCREADGALTFCTLPLPEGTWNPVPFTCLIAVRDGRSIRVGEPHGHDFVPPPSKGE